MPSGKLKILKSLVIIFGLISLATFSTGAYFSDSVAVSGNQFSTGTWPTPEAKLIINEIDYDQPGMDAVSYEGDMPPYTEGSGVGPITPGDSND